ncbi:MAG: type II secretion system F family protein [Tenericutes bacterium]|nr:type II secretion system F family protein [Mycoplasmatota bacterium]
MKLRNYKYIAENQKGKIVKGHFETINKYTCTKYLESKNLKVKKLTESNNIFTKLNQIVVSAVLKKRQLIFFLKQLSALLKAGITITSALEVLALQQDNKYLRRLFFTLNLDIGNGLTFSQALGKHPKEFPKMLIQMVEIGEISGNLHETILKMADYYDKQAKISSSIKSTVRMPIMYLGLTIVVAVGLVLFVFPSITDLFVSIDGAELPGITAFFLNASDFMANNIIIILVVTIVGAAGIYFLYNYVPKVKYFFSAALLKTPIFGQLIQMYNQILIANSLSQMLSSGINTLYALQTIRELLSNVVYIELIENTIRNITDGSPFSKSFLESDYIDPIMARMVATGENTGDIPSLMNGLSEYYNDMSELRIEKIKNTLQPVLLIIVYTIIGVMLLAIMLPMLSLGSQI